MTNQSSGGFGAAGPIGTICHSCAEGGGDSEDNRERRPSRRERPSGSARSSFKIRDALQAEKREGEGSKRVGRDDALLGRLERRSAKKTCPGLPKTEFGASAGRGASPPARLKPQAGRAGTGGCCSTFYLQESQQPFRAAQDPRRATVPGSDQGTPACKPDLGLPHIQTSPGALVLTRTVQTMQFRLPSGQGLWQWALGRLDKKAGLRAPLSQESPKEERRIEVVRFSGLLCS